MTMLPQTKTLNPRFIPSKAYLDGITTYVKNNILKIIEQAPKYDNLNELANAVDYTPAYLYQLEREGDFFFPVRSKLNPNKKNIENHPLLGEMLVNAKKFTSISKLAEAYGLSRTRLYQLEDQYNVRFNVRNRQDDLILKKNEDRLKIALNEFVLESAESEFYLTETEIETYRQHIESQPLYYKLQIASNYRWDNLSKLSRFLNFSRTTLYRWEEKFELCLVETQKRHSYI